MRLLIKTLDCGFSSSLDQSWMFDHSNCGPRDKTLDRRRWRGQWSRTGSFSWGKKKRTRQFDGWAVRRDTLTVKGLVHDSHFYVNVRPGVKSCEVTYTQSERASFFFFLFLMTWSVVVVGSAALVHSGSLCNDGVESETASSESRDLSDLTAIRTVASHHETLSKKLCVLMFFFLVNSTDWTLPVTFFFFRRRRRRLGCGHGGRAAEVKA